MTYLSRRGLLGAGSGALALSAVSGGAHAASSTGRGARGVVRSTVRRMTLPQKVGQLFMSEVHGIDPTVPDARNERLFGIARAVDVVRELHLGGVIYFGWTDSFRDGPRGVATLSNALQDAARTVPRGGKVAVPLLVATDQEMGVVTRLGKPATQFPGSMALGAGRSTTDARVAAEITGMELRAVGINVDFAPDADVNVDPANPVIGVRAFSSDPELVARLVAAQVRGYQGRGHVASAAKHFPGHGDTATDSHVDLPVIDHDLDEWRRIDLPPFRAASATGIDMMRTALLLVPALDDSGVPATLSKRILTDVLRGELGYEGVIVTDSLAMAGVRERFGDDAEVAVRALEAGADLLLMSPEPVKARDAILAAIRSGRLPERDIERKVERILELKHRRGIVRTPTVDVDAVDGFVGNDAHERIARDVTDRTITLTHHDGLLPFEVRAKQVLVAGWGPSTTTDVAAAFERAGATVERIVTGDDPTAEQIEQCVRAARGNDLTVLLTYDVEPDSAQVRLVTALTEAGATFVAVAVRNPYDVARYDAANALCTYSTSPVMAESLVRVVTGLAEPRGKLPVDVPTADGTGIALPFGHGLST